MLLRTAAAVLIAFAGVAAPAFSQEGETIRQTVGAEPTVQERLTIGDKAPALSAQEWLKGDEVTEFRSGHVYIVEFWATWCGPCIAAIPHLTDLQEEYGDKLTIIGMTSGDTRGNTLENVQAFVQQPPSEMGYTVAFDQERETWNRYMTASGQGGIPTSFIVNQQGQIAWIGHPLSMDDALEQIVAGEYDMDAAIERQRRETDLQAQADPLLMQVQQMLQEGDAEGAMEVIDRIVALDHELFGQLGVQKLQFLMFQMNDEAGALMYGKKLFDEILVDNPEMINGVSWSILTTDGIPPQYHTIGFYGARKANELTGGEDPMILDTLARAQYMQDDLDEALKTQRKAVELAKEQGKLNGSEIAELEERLAEYEEMAGDE